MTEAPSAAGVATCSDGDSFTGDVLINYDGYAEMDGCYEILNSFTEYDEVNYFLDYGDGQPFFKTADSLGGVDLDNVSEELEKYMLAPKVHVYVVYFTGVL